MLLFLPRDSVAVVELAVLHALIRISGLARQTDTLLIHVFILFSALGARHLGPIHLAMNEVEKEFRDLCGQDCNLHW